MNLADLNPQQIQAIKHIDGPLLILAGAGSGKTKTLTTRLAYLISEVGIPSSSILCLTFTNKASAEMKERALKLIEGEYVDYPLLCTFHKFGLLFLKEYIDLLGRSSSFLVIDSDDRKRIIRSLGSSIASSVLLGHIAHFKNQALDMQEAMNRAKNEEAKKIAGIYGDYQDYLESKNLVDFDDLLYLPYVILHRDARLRERISEQYGYIMVDEYQDTNTLQYKLLRLLTSTHENLCVVGDEDQSIYAWRGADIRNILEFGRDFANAKIIKLEQNYRSTPQILEFANRLIAHNTQRLGKTLYAMQEDGEEVEIQNFYDERQETAKIAEKIRELFSQGVGCKEIAILYRINALSRGVEEGLSKAGIPHQLIGSIPFYERAEIKDALSYLRLMLDCGDDFSLLRVLNKPKRGIGETSQERLKHLASGSNIYTLFSQKPDLIPPKILPPLKEFFSLIDSLRNAFRGPISGFRVALEQLPILEHYDELERADRKENLSELFGRLEEFFAENPGSSMEDFLNDLSLMSAIDKDSTEKISCMSIHLSKGLEFDYVFVIGCEEGVFPLKTDMLETLNPDALEEERRLGYVAFTRARKQLFLSHVKCRLHHGRRKMLTASRFLKEARGNRPREITQEAPIQKGSLVRHKIFGLGRVCELIGKGIETKAKVNFGGNERLILLNFLELAE